MTSSDIGKVVNGLGEILSKLDDLQNAIGAFDELIYNIVWDQLEDIVREVKAAGIFIQKLAEALSVQESRKGSA